jgi:hypothetical protein
MDPMTIAAIAQQGVKTALGIGQMISGGAKLRKANKNRPNYDIPQEYADNIALSDKFMNMGMPREQYVAQLQGIQRNQNFGLRALGDRGGALAGIGSLVQQGNDATMKLNAADATMRNQNIARGTQMKMSAKYQMGMQKLAKQQWDKFNPFLAKVAQAQGLIGAGMQNLGGGLDGGSMVAMNSMGGQGGSSSGGGSNFNQWYNQLNRDQPWLG